MGKSITAFICSILVLAIMVGITVFGFNLGFTEIPAAKDGIRQGLDLKGGSVIVFEAQAPEGLSDDELKSGMESVQKVLRNRLDAQQYSEATIQLNGDKRVRVEIPEVTNPEDAVELLGKTAMLEFRDADGNVELTGADIKSAKAQYSAIEENGRAQHHVVVELNSDAVAKFAEMTKKAAGRSADGKNYIEIVLDGVVQSAPFVGAEYASTGINSESVVISMGSEDSFTVGGGQNARELALVIESGSLPFDLKDVELRSVGPTLGEKSLERSLIAGFIGLLLVLIFMVVVYRLPGLVADLALVFFAALFVIVLALCKVNLSLSGIAGIILSIGMAVDANVIIFERLKEELRTGKTLKASIDAGYKRAFTAILDANVTTLIASCVLYFLGTGTIRGFALTLGIGVILSMFTALVVSRFLLNQLVGMNIKAIKAYGA